MKRKLHDLFRVSMPISLLFLWPFCTQAGEHNNMVVPDANVSFIENVGQMIDENYVPREDIDFRLQGTAVNMFVSNHGLQYVWTKASTIESISSGRLSDIKGSRSNATAFDLYSLYVDMVGANPNARPEVAEQISYYENYYLPYCKGKTAHSYKKVVYKNIYPNIDWVLYTDEGKKGGFKYDFIVHKGGKVSDIKLQYHGATSIKVVNGALEVMTENGSITEQAPYSYDAITGNQVSSSYTLNGNILGLQAASTDNDLVIDPSIAWSTYFGNPHRVYATCVAADTSGNSFLCGSTAVDAISIVPLFKPNTYHEHIKGGTDGFVLSLDITGTKRNFTTYFGGNDEDEILAATTDIAGNLYIAGITASMTDLAYGSPQQTTNDGNGLSGSSRTDGFLAKFQGSGYISWSTYVGGSQVDNCFAVAVDRSNGVYVGGSTNSTDTIPTSGTFNTTGGDGFLIKYNQTTGRRIWGSFFTSEVDAIAVDNKQNVYIGGSTTKYTGIATTGSFQATFHTGGATDGYVARFNAANGTRIWGTYYGGDTDDAVTSLVCDSLYNVYLGGTTTSASANLATSGAIRTTPGTGMMAKLDSSGARVWGTYYVAGITSMALGPDNKVYFGGQTDSTTDVATPGSYQTSYTQPDFSRPGPNPPPIYDAFFGKLNNSGKRLWSSYFGGPNMEKFTTVSYGFGRLYIGGYTDSKAGIATPGSLQDVMADTNISYIAQFHSDTSVYIKFPYVDTLLCEGGPLDLKYGVTDTFNSNNVFTVQMSDINGSFANAVNIGTANTTRQGVVHCTMPNPAVDGVGYKLRIIASSPADTFYNYDMPIRVSEYPNPEIHATSPAVCENSTLVIYDINTEPTGTNYIWGGPGGFINYVRGSMSRGPLSLSDAGKYYVETDNHGCKARDTTLITIIQSPADPVLTGDTSICIGDSLALTAHSATPGVTYTWQGPNLPSGIDTSLLVIQNMDMSNGGIYKVAAVIQGVCGSAFTSREVVVHPLPYPSTFSNSPICSGDTLKFNATDTIAGVTYSWTGPNNFTSSSQNNVIPNATEPYTGTYKLTTTSIYGCKGSVNMKVNVNRLPEQVKAINNGPTCTGLDLQLNANNGTPNATYSWTGPNGYSSSQQNPYLSGVQLANQGLYTVVVDLNGCKKQDTTSVTIYQSPDTPKLSSNSPVKTGGIIKLFILNQQVGATYTWTGPNSFYSQFPNPVLNSVVPASAGVYKVVSTIGVCNNEDTITVKILDDSVRSMDPMVIFPNPNNGTFTIKGSTKTNENVEITIYASDGKEVFSDVVEPQNYMLNHTVHFTGAANGIYRLKLFVDRKVIYLSFTLGV
ncbi:MAG: SBBP repeat-containing protein [Bacteroidetes bacterium]|nr:SBBP repeat-containing protein [Bacteroidota bacterium]